MSAYREVQGERVGLPDTRWDFDADVPLPGRLGRTHVIAIGGAGMSGVATLLRDAGVEVCGCDGQSSGTVEVLRRKGVDVRIGHDPDHLRGIETLVVSSAIRETNPELVAARETGLRVLHRSQALASVARAAECRIAVAGANGKTTTSSMIAVALTFLGWDPSYALGGEPIQLRRNAAHGAGQEFVIEADESDGSFVVYRPHVVIVTSVQPDHLDFYGDLRAVEAAYRELVVSMEAGGLLVICGDDPGAARLADWARQLGVRVITYGEDTSCDVRLSAVREEGMRTVAVVHVADQSHPLSLQVPGAHNALNAAGALAAIIHGPGATTEDGVAIPEAVPAVLSVLARFTGVRRRFERVGVAAGVTVVDDYAHNPAKVAALVRAGRAVAGEGRLIVAFQPHLYSRTRDFAAQFGAALAGADVVLVTDVYAAREDPVPGVDGGLVAAAIRAARPDATVQVVPALADVPAALADLAQEGDLVVTVGAGNITTVGPLLVGLLQERA